MVVFPCFLFLSKLFFFSSAASLYNGPIIRRLQGRLFLFTKTELPHGRKCVLFFSILPPAFYGSRFFSFPSPPDIGGILVKKWFLGWASHYAFERRSLANACSGQLGELIVLDCCAGSGRMVPAGPKRVFPVLPAVYGKPHFCGGWVTHCGNRELFGVARSLF